MVRASSEDRIPRLPLKGAIDLTYRCDNACRHCWLWAADTPEERRRELTTGEWKAVVDQARALGTREWAISGGEPMLRDDFAELFEYVTAKARAYSLNTNGTLITPEIAQLLRRKGQKMVAVYGATAEVYEAVTGNPDGFEALLEGVARLKEAGAGFTVQLVPMRANWHQWDAMLELARSMSDSRRVGAAWLHASACGGAAGTARIAAERLDPADVVALDEPVLGDDSAIEPLLDPLAPGDDPDDTAGGERAGCGPGDDRVYAACIAGHREFHVDPYGGMSFCGFVKDPALRFDLRAGAPVTAHAPVATDAPGSAGAPTSAGEPAPAPGIAPGAVAAAWEEFIPAAAERVRGAAEYLEGCGACELRADCRWCAVYGYLEHGRHGARVEYLCEVAREACAWKARRARDHRRYFAIGGMVVRVDSDLPIDEYTFAAKFRQFEVGPPGAGADVLTINHHFGLPDLDGRDLGEPVRRQPPWLVYRKGSSWIYLNVSAAQGAQTVHQVAVYSNDHSHLQAYNDEHRAELWRRGGLGSLTVSSTDQIMLSRVLADRGGCFLHSGGVVIGGEGILFVGHSGAGKSTTMGLLEGVGEVLCDDRNIVRAAPEGGFRVYGTWSHGERPVVSALDAPLGAVVFLRQSEVNRIDRLHDRAKVRHELLGTIIRPLTTVDWWDRSLATIARLADEVPCYEMRFDRSGAIVPLVEDLAARSGAERQGVR